jgi:hypothetical protein
MSRSILTSGLVTSVLALSLSAGCLTREVAREEPTTKISFDTVVPQPAIDKVDVLVMVDNSSSMADKQRILADAVPDLVRGLVQPKCVDKKTRAPTGAFADPLKPEGAQCAGGSEPAFTPITDMHIGVISSSLGGMGSKTCAPAPGRDNDDKGHLLARGEGGKNVAEAGDLGFLAWYPPVAQNQNKDRHPDPPVPASATIDGLSNAFKKLVVGVGQSGCGLEAQLESVYRFLVQPDPWNTIEVDPATKRATYGAPGDIDTELLRQRAAFLRPDSLVAVIVLTDEDDSSADPLSFDGTGWIFGEDQRVSRGTSTCASSPASPSCTSCELVRQCDPKDAACAKLKNDPVCATTGGVYEASEDSLNVRFHQMKRRFGVDPQFPISRYVDAFTKPKVPRRASEHDRGTYVGKADCTNPLFAARLPGPGDDPCKLPRGPRTSDLVYFALIGGVPNQLLPDSGESAAIDWTKILGKDPAHYDESGIDSHMIPSTQPRPGLPGPTAADNADPESGREWTTNGTDLQFACTFDLYENTDGAIVPTKRACPANDTSQCDCDGKKDTPLCDPADKKVQIRGKAYPTRRELIVAKELGDHAVVASLCPKQLTAPDKDDYGYRPAVRSITKRLEDTLTASCLPRQLTRDTNDSVPCLVLATLPEPGPEETCTKLGLAIPRADLLARVRDKVAQEDGEESRLLPVCEVPQVPVPQGESCRDEAQKQGFCYAQNVPGVRCSQSILFTKPTTHIVGARFRLQCITVDGATQNH